MNLLLPLLLLTVIAYEGLRLVFLLWNAPLFRSLPTGEVASTFFYGLRFDFSVIAILSAPALIVLFIAFLLRKNWNKIAAWLFVATQAAGLILNLGDTEYIQFTGRRFTISMLAVTQELEGKISATILSNLPLFLISCVFVAFFLATSWWFIQKCSEKSVAKNWKKQLAVGAALFLILFVAARGGLQSKPIGFAHAQVFATPVLNQLTINSSFSLIQSLKRAPLPREHYMSEDQMRALMNGSLPGKSLMDGQRLQEPQNVVIVILESFSLEHMGKLHGDSGYTPFLDELSEKGLFFPNAYANGRRSIEGIGAILAGVPALMSEPFISSQYATNTFYGLGTVLGQFGYSSVFYHGGKNGTMYFDQFTRSAGIPRYYGASEYPNPQDSDGTWGIWDEPFLQNAVQDLKNEKEPFAANIFTLSSHNPFKVPTQFEGKFPKGTSEIHAVVGYTDYALRKFFESASKEPWFERTLFIVTADHTFKPVRPEYQNDLGNYRVPLILYHPKISKWPAVNTKEPVQHIDLLPTILDFLGKPNAQENLMGRSMFRDGSRYVVLYSDATYWLVTQDNVLTMDGRGDVKFLKEDPAAQSDLLLKLQATRQYFSEGLWDNRLYYPAK